MSVPHVQQNAGGGQGTRAGTAPRRRLPALIAILVIVVTPLVCGLVFLAHAAPRDWSLHWVAPRTIVSSTSGNDLAAATSPGGWSALWTDRQGSLQFARFNTAGVRVGPQVRLQGSPQMLTLAHVGRTDVAVWRQDTNSGSALRAALLTPGRAPLYRSLAGGPWSLEHPQAFTAGNAIDVVFSWQRSAFDLYLVRVFPDGRVSTPVRLTHAASYAFNPRAASDPFGGFELVYMDQCCGGSTFRLVTARYTAAGRAVGRPIALDRIVSAGGAGSSATPTEWGLDIAAIWGVFWVAWAGDNGLDLARIEGSRVLNPRETVVPGVPAQELRLAASGSHVELIWAANFDLGSMLATVSLGPDGMPLAAPDRVAYEAASDSIPAPLVIAGEPGLLWQALPAKSPTSRIETSHFTPQAQGAPSVWAKLGLGLAAPLGNILLLLFGAMALGALITAGNVFLALGLVAVYLILLRLAPQSLRTPLFISLIGVLLFALLVILGAPFPPLLFFSALSVDLGVVAIGGMLLFVGALSWLALRRIDPAFRAAAIAFASLYFLAFLQALTIMQGQLARI